MRSCACFTIYFTIWTDLLTLACSLVYSTLAMTIWTSQSYRPWTGWYSILPLCLSFSLCSQAHRFVAQILNRHAIIYRFLRYFVISRCQYFYLGQNELAYCSSNSSSRPYSSEGFWRMKLSPCSRSSGLLKAGLGWSVDFHNSQNSTSICICYYDWARLSTSTPKIQIGVCDLHVHSGVCPDSVDSAWQSAHYKAFWLFSAVGCAPVWSNHQQNC